MPAEVLQTSLENIDCAPITLFDLNLIGIDPDTMRITIDPSLKGEPYAGLEGRRLQIQDGSGRPSDLALRAKWGKFKRVERIAG